MDNNVKYDILITHLATEFLSLLNRAWRADENLKKIKLTSEN